MSVCVCAGGARLKSVFHPCLKARRSLSMVQAWSKQWHPGETFAGPVAPSFFTSSARWIDRQQPPGRPSSACLNEERGRRHVKPAVDVAFLCREDVSIDRIEGILRDKMCVRKVNRRRIRGLCVRPFPCRYARVNGGEMHPRCVRNFFSRFDRHCHPLSSSVERELHRCSRSGSRHRAGTTPAASHAKISSRSYAQPYPSQRLLESALRMRP